MGFGFSQAREAGAPYRTPRSSSAMNLEEFLKRHPELRNRVEDMRKDGRNSNGILTYLRDEGLDGRFCLSLYQDAEAEKWVRNEFSDDREKLEENADWGFDHGVYKYAELSEYDDKTGEWTCVRYWPEETN